MIDWSAKAWEVMLCKDRCGFVHDFDKWALPKVEAALREAYEQGCKDENEACEVIAQDTSAFAVEPGNRFDAGYSQGRFEAGARIRQRRTNASTKEPK